MTVTKKRASGVLMPIFSLHGSYSCGAFGKAALEFVDFLADSGFSYWQVLPFSIPDEHGSPYKSDSAFAGDPRLIDLEVLAAEGLLTEEELQGALQAVPFTVETDRMAAREALLRRAATRVENKKDILDFIEGHPQLDNACRFLALKKANGGLAWQEWKTADWCEEDYFYYAFAQYHFLRQWQAVKTYANGRGISIIGDLPIYVAEDSADVWSAPDCFLLDKKGYPKEVAGVPPDYFCSDGQMWGNPLYDWSKMKKDGFSWWRDRMRHILTLFDGVRIDHFRGLSAYWSIPASAATAKEGAWKKGPGMAFVRAMKEVAGDKLIIAEDLGEITEDVIALREKSGFPGMRVFQFAFLGDPDSIHLPHHYPANCVAYTGTHDNNTLLGYVWEQDAASRERMLQYCHHESPDWDACYEAILKTMLQSHAGLVIFPIQDLLGFGSDTRFNTPGRTENNWCFRVTREQLLSLDRARLLALNRLYGRA